MRDTDDASVWKAISWERDFGAGKNDKDTCPSDEEFKVHFERVLNPTPTPSPLHVTIVLTIPVLDDPITPAEVECQIKKLKAGKPAGMTGSAQVYLQCYRHNG